MISALEKAIYQEIQSLSKAETVFVIRTLGKYLFPEGTIREIALSLVNGEVSKYTNILHACLVVIRSSFPDKKSHFVNYIFTIALDKYSKNENSEIIG